MGPSGCGKSTLLHVLGLMTPPEAGVVMFDSRPVSLDAAGRTAIRRDRIGFVFQRFNLIGVLSAADNVAISLKVRRRRDDGRAAELFETLGLRDVVHRRPGQLSIGEQQRVAVVRALAHRPDLLLADEPAGNLDSANATHLLEIFRQVNRQDRQTIVMITHSAEAARAADRIVYMKDGQLLDDKP
jgi:putative ABC transport system ATP-binding protein